MKIKDEHIAKLLLGLPNTENTLVLSDGASYKFWCIYEDEDGNVSTTYGKIGSKPRVSKAIYGGGLERNEYYVNSKIREKLNKGYKKLLDILD